MRIEKPGVSVIIPIYNTEKYLRQCLDSVTGQTFADLEIILVDDGSTDGSPGICADYAVADARIKVIRQENGGLSAARNTGMAHARGEWIYFLDSDDYIAADTMEALHGYATGNQADFVFFDSYSVSEDGKMLRDRGYSHLRKHSHGTDTGAAMASKLLGCGEYRSTVPLLFINRAVLLRLDLSFYPGILHEDNLFTFHLFLGSDRVSHYAHPLYYYRQGRKGSIMASKNGKKHFAGYLTVLTEMNKFYMANSQNAAAEGCARLLLGREALLVEIAYHECGRKERWLLKEQKKEVDALVRKFMYFDDWRLRLACHFPNIYAMLRGIYRKLPAGLLEDAKTAFNRLRFHPQLRALRSSSGRKRIVLLGTPVHGNLGDHAIAVATIECLRDFAPGYEVAEIPKMLLLKGREEIVFANIQKDDIIAIMGGGWMGTLWKPSEYVIREIIGRFPDRKIVIFPQTVFYEDSEYGRADIEAARKIYQAHKDLTICLRERSSYDFITTHGFADREHSLLIPDMALYMTTPKPAKKRKGVLLCLRRDCEKVVPEEWPAQISDALQKRGETVTHASTHVHRYISVRKRGHALEKKLQQFGKARLVITDRLHSMIFAAVMGTPCLAFDNLSGKVFGVYDEWLRELEYVRIYDDKDDIDMVIGEMLALSEVSHNYERSPGRYGEMMEKVLSTETGI